MGMAYGLNSSDFTRDTNSLNKSSSSSLIFLKSAINGTKSVHAKNRNVGQEMSSKNTTNSKNSTVLMSKNEGKNCYFYTKSILEHAGGIFGLKTSSYCNSGVEKHPQRANLRRAKSQFRSSY